MRTNRRRHTETVNIAIPVKRFQAVYVSSTKHNVYALCIILCSYPYILVIFQITVVVKRPFFNSFGNFLFQSP